ncbi:MAG: NUDIX domain-containing protein [Thermomicrobium sp.]|nr:NUDIX domain-containing protein [Thermomicrobium sp.]MDW8059631.1 NUDIX domain-containing protein [Thermomicrobium sp.]
MERETTRPPTTDPQDERLDVLTAEGARTGTTASRGEVHARGLWHPAFHLWIAYQERGEFTVLLQRRSLTKDTMPGKVDVSVGGHFRAGEYDPGNRGSRRVLRAVCRELAEELGLAVDPGVLRWVGTRWSEACSAGVVDREVQELFVWLPARRPERLVPDPREVSAVLAVPVGALRRLLGDGVEADVVVLWRDGTEPLGREHVGRADLVPGRGGYWLAMLELLERWRHGQEFEPLVLRDQAGCGEEA